MNENYDILKAQKDAIEARQATNKGTKENLDKPCECDQCGAIFPTKDVAKHHCPMPHPTEWREYKDKIIREYEEDAEVFSETNLVALLRAFDKVDPYIAAEIEKAERRGAERAIEAISKMRKREEHLIRPVTNTLDDLSALLSAYEH